MSNRILRILSELSDIYATAFEEIDRLSGESEHTARTARIRSLELAPKGAPQSRSLEAISDDILATYKSELSDVYQAALEETQRLRGDRNTNKIKLDEVREMYERQREELRQMRLEHEREIQTIESLTAVKKRGSPVGRVATEPESVRGEQERLLGTRVCRSCGNRVGPRDLFCDRCGSFLIRIYFS